MCLGNEESGRIESRADQVPSERANAHASANSREGDRPQPVVDAQLERRAVAAAQQPLALVPLAAAVDRPDGVRNVFRGEAVAARELGLARVGAVERAALAQETKTGGRVDGAVDCAKTKT